MAAKISAGEWGVFQCVSETYALPGSPQALSPAAFNHLLRSRITARGQRFKHDHPDTAVYIERSKNANVVAYTVTLCVPVSDAAAVESIKTDSLREHEHYMNVTKHGEPPAGHVNVPSGVGRSCEVDTGHPIHPYFVRLEPSYVAARRKKKIMTDCDELGYLEKKFAYGCKTTVFDCAAQITPQLSERVAAGSALSTALAPSASGASAESCSALLTSLQTWWGAFQPVAAHFVALPEWPAFILRLSPIEAAAAASSAESSNGSSSTAKDTMVAMLAVIDGKLSVLEKVYVKSIERFMRLPQVEYIEVRGTCVADGSATYEKKMNDGSHKAPDGVTAEDVRAEKGEVAAAGGSDEQRE